MGLKDTEYTDAEWIHLTQDKSLLLLHGSQPCSYESQAEYCTLEWKANPTTKTNTEIDNGDKAQHPQHIWDWIYKSHLTRSDKTTSNDTIPFLGADIYRPHESPGWMYALPECCFGHGRELV
jgi:hypothetical protein